MNKYIKSDLENSITQMKVAIMNALYDIDSGEENIINLGLDISSNLLYKCLIKSGWKEKENLDWKNRINFTSKWISPSGKNVIIDGSFWGNQDYIISTLC